MAADADLLNHAWDLEPRAARALQEQLRELVIAEDDFAPPRTVAGVDVGFEDGGRVTRAAVVVLDYPALTVRDDALVREPTRFPYVPGLLSFRETPAVLAALDALTAIPDLLLCDGHGRAHPRRFGIACHIGLRAGIPAIGIGKSILVGAHDTLAEAKGEQQRLIHDDEIIGMALRSRERVRPIYISVGHRVSLETAVQIVQRCVTRYRLPETTRLADRRARAGSKPLRPSQ